MKNRKKFKTSSEQHDTINNLHNFTIEILIEFASFSSMFFVVILLIWLESIVVLLESCQIHVRRRPDISRNNLRVFLMGIEWVEWVDEHATFQWSRHRQLSRNWITFNAKKFTFKRLEMNDKRNWIDYVSRGWGTFLLDGDIEIFATRSKLLREVLCHINVIRSGSCEIN